MPPSRCKARVESHARFADNRITTSGRAEDLDITATVWVGRRRGAATGNDAERRRAEADGRRSGADRARVAGAPRVRADARAARVPGDRAASPRRRPTSTSTARAAALEAVLDRVPRREGHGRRLSHRDRVGDAPPRPPTATAATSDRARRGFSVTARSADGTGSGYFAGDHFDLARLDARSIAEQAVEQGGPIAAAEADRAGRLPGHPRAAGGRGPDRIPDRQLRRAHRRRRAQRVLRQGRQDAASARSCSASASTSTATRCIAELPAAPEHRRRRSRRRGCR